MATKNGFDRRRFLHGVGGAVLARAPAARMMAGEAPPALRLEWLLDQARGGLLPPPPFHARRGSERYWREVRDGFVFSDDYIHFNTGTTGTQPRFSLVNLLVYNLYKSADPRDWEENLASRFPEFFPRAKGLNGPSPIAARQAAIAAQYGADPDEIVLSYNTTDALNLVFAGTPWSAGDRIVTTHWEHPALRGPSAWARDTFGVELREVGLPSQFTEDITQDDVLSLFEAELARPLPRGAKQYLALSEIFYKNGLRLPIEALSGMARRYGAFTIIDSAHGWGQLAIDAHAYGADFIAGAGHKWLCGGPGTGIFYVRSSGTGLPPFRLGNFFQYAAVDARTRGYAPAFYVQPRGELNTPALYALTDSAAFFREIGVREIHARGLVLASYLRGKIAERWGKGALWVQQHSNQAFQTALVSFNPFRARDADAQYAAVNAAASAVVARLASERPKIYARTVSFRDRPSDPADNRVGFRLSTHGVYNTFAEIDHVVERLTAAVDASGLAQLA